jgi:hypothetical protein
VRRDERGFLKVADAAQAMIDVVDEMEAAQASAD